MEKNENIWEVLSSLHKTIESRKAEYEKWKLDEK